ncbi:hypothetical protein BLS_010180 [Venturia inaequalis]|uniref:Uncharacterized protein n=1 Tax=Venturia inaequalis TaxID=5025 RepID=A0A8H3U3W1_VENIN|nr:hypothetical protein BLS_010180 [Venturia inaequalis]KAE9965413.1 hypothetical protein EG328_009665 [Venturia inaequalis]RDI79186.1 hypothetical protein Vi05172_g10806 [Venturia inaequalis]
MKSFSLALLAFAASVLAAPQDAPPKGATYTLTVKSSVDTLNNKALSAKDGKVGIFSGGPAAKFLTSQYTGSNTLSLHPGTEEHQLALSGSSGLLELVDVVNPTGDKIPQGQSMEWSTFVIDGQGNVNVNDGADIPSRRWVAYTNADGSYGVGLYDGFTVPPPKEFQNVTLVAVKA